jgi:hypothetical protein
MACFGYPAEWVADTIGMVCRPDKSARAKEYEGHRRNAQAPLAFCRKRTDCAHDHNEKWKHCVCVMKESGGEQSEEEGDSGQYKRPIHSRRPNPRGGAGASVGGN